MSNKPNKAFSLVELSIVILIIGVLIAAAGQGIDLLQDARLTAARMLTQSSRVASLKGLSLWLETTSENSFSAAEAADGSTVTSWNDINPQARDRSNAIQSTTASKPTYNTNIINSLPAVKFDGVNDYLDTTEGFAMDKGLSIFIVMRPVVVAPSSDLSASTIEPSNQNSSAGFGLRMGSSILNTYYQCVNCGLVQSAAPSLANTNYLIEAVDDSTTMKLYVNKLMTQASNQSGGQGLKIRSSYLEIGACYGVDPGGPCSTRDRYLNGYIAELILFDRGLTEKERLSVETYLNKKWKIF